MRSSSRRLSASLENFSTTFSHTTIDESPKIVEVDTGRPKSRCRRTNASFSDLTDDPHYPTLSSPLPPSRVSTRVSIPDSRSFQESEWGLTGDECRFSTAHSTPRFVNLDGSGAPVTPAKSFSCGGDHFFGQYNNYPNYMAKTKSFKAKLRSHSAPKQRPGPGPKRRLSLNEMMESRSSLSGVRMQKSCSQAQEIISFKNTVMGKLDRFMELSRENERIYVKNKW